MRILRPEEVDKWPGPRELTPEELREAYALAKASFTAEDLQRCMEVEEGVPMEDFLEELEEVQQKANFGEPLFHLRALKLMVYQVVILPVVVIYVVHEEKPLVFLKSVKLLS